MRLRSLIAAAVSVCVFMAVFAVAVQTAEAELQICKCACTDPDATRNLLRPPRGSPAQNEAECVSACSGISAPYYDWEYRASDDRLVCTCLNPDASWEYRELSSGQLSCTADCAAACGGTAYVSSTQDMTRNIETVACLDTSDCTPGAFRHFEDVTCSYSQTSGDWPLGVPYCNIPITARNADIECQLFAGEASGGTTNYFWGIGGGGDYLGTGSKCMFIGQNSNPNADYKTRPWLNADGEYQTPVSFDDENTIQDLYNALAQDNAKYGANRRPGICTMYGASGDALPSETDISGIVAGIGQMALEDVLGTDLGPSAYTPPENRYLCAKRKSNTCGLTTIPANKQVQTAASYTCMTEAQRAGAGITNESLYCIGENEGVTYQGTSLEGRDLCVNLVGGLCCARGGCQADIECGLFKKCDNGRCIPDPVCDPDNPTRVCRSNVPAPERANPGRCTLAVGAASGLTVGVQPICPGNYTCCEPQDSMMQSGCAADLWDNPDFQSTWRDHLCVDPGDLPDSEWWINPANGARQLRSYENGGMCLTGAVEVGASAEARCSGGKVCCHKDRVMLGNYWDFLEERPENGMECDLEHPNPIKKCISPDAIIFDWQLGERGFASREAYFEALGNSSYCSITPRVAGSYITTNECQDQYVCCSWDVLAGNFCTDDGACAAGKRCDLYLKLCVDAALAEEKVRSSNCVDKAETVDGVTNSAIVLNASGAPRDAFGCKEVPEDEAMVQTHCLQGGCSDMGEGLLCCAPGVGFAPGGEETEEGAVAAVTPGRFTIGLPSCISSGDCTLDDIVTTGANFANFLIGISGSVFLAIFVYAGFLYLTAGGSDRAKKAKKMLVQSTIGLFLMLGGFILVNFLQSSLISQAVGGGAAVECGNTEETKGMVCTPLNASEDDDAAISKEIDEKGCVRGKCPGPKNYVCCPS